MSWLVRLYPEAWRDRYEPEFLALLEARPPTGGDVVDTIRGAVDAHLHPHLSGGAVEPSPWTHRIPGLLAMTAGATWSSTVLYMAFWPSPNWDGWSLTALSAVFMFISLPGDYMAAQGRRIAIAFGLLGACLVGASIAPWPLMSLFAAAGYLIALGGMLSLAGIRAGIGSSERWILLTLAIIVPVVVSLPAAFGFVRIDQAQPFMLTIVLPYGLAWLFVGLRMAIRGAPTIVDLPVTPIEPEVRAA